MTATIFRSTYHFGPVRGVTGWATEESIQKDQRRARAGKPLFCHEPTPGHVAIYPYYSAQADGPAVRVPIVEVRS